jgi:dTMP kinase
MLVDAKSFKLEKLPTFIALDGLNGAGKSTLQSKLVTYLEGRNIAVRATREPGGTDVGQTLRNIVLNQGERRLEQTTELFLFAADRAEHVGKIIRPALDGKISVITDRYYYSTVAFQGFGRGVNRNVIEAVNSVAIGNTVPNLFLFLDLDPAVGLKRIAQARTEGSRGNDSFEAEELRFHEHLREGFKTLAREVREPCLVIDATLPAEEVFGQVKVILDRSFGSAVL